MRSSSEAATFAALSASRSAAPAIASAPSFQAAFASSSVRGVCHQSGGTNSARWVTGESRNSRSVSADRSQGDQAYSSSCVKRRSGTARPMETSFAFSRAPAC